MEISFKGKKALVTGAGRGIGRSVALKLAECGADVVAVSRTQATLDTLKAEYDGSGGGSIQTLCVDLSHWAATERALSTLGPIHLLVNNAGTNIEQAFGDVTEDAFDTVYNINVKSLLHVTQVVMRPLYSSGSGGEQEMGGGAVVNVSSQASQRALPSHLVYCSSKAAVDMITRSMAAEMAQHKIRVNAVNPTVVLTDLGLESWSDPAKARPMLARIPLARFAGVPECVDVILYLLSDKASMINGAILPVDGGFWTT